MTSISGLLIDKAFRAAMLGEPKSKSALLRRSRRISSLIRPPATLPNGVSVKKTTIGNEPGVPPGVPAICVSTVAPKTTVVYLHGGAFICGQFHTYAGICGQLAKELNARVFWIDYRLAPESPFPAAIDDAFYAFNAICDDYPSSPLVLMGESAGANLALVTLLRIRDRLMEQPEDRPPSLRLPSCCVAMSPPTDLANESLSRHANKRKDAILSPKMIELATQMYIVDHNPKDPYVSPVYADLHNLPPTLVTVSDSEAIRDDSYRFVAKARDEGVSVEMITRRDALHAWPVLYTIMPEAKTDFAKIVSFVKRKVRDAKFQVSV